MARRIAYITPAGADFFDALFQEYLDPAKDPRTDLQTLSLKRGPHHLEFHYYESLVLQDTLHLIRQKEKEGFDAAIIGCFYDPGLREAREITERMVVTAPAESSMHIASTLGNSFSIIVGRNKWIPAMHENVVKYGFKDRLASFKSVGLGVLEFMKDVAETNRRLIEAAREAVEKDRAEVIILGCTIQFGFYRELEQMLGVPVIDAVLAPLKYVEFLVEIRDRFGWGHSKKYGYESPPLQEIEEWKIAEQYNLENLWKK